MDAAADRPLPTLPKEFANTCWFAEGGMSWVYTTHYRPLDRIEIIKLLKPDTADNADSFLREGRAMARLSSRHHHPNICQVLDVGRCPQGPYIRMEYIEGPTLQEYMCEGDGPKLQDIIQLLTELADALDHAHSRGVVHSDLKPENVLLTHNTRSNQRIPKLIDFGIARHLTAAIENDIVIRGTLPYMAPEQIRGEGPTAHSDQYALGIMTFELLTGLLPFSGPRESIIEGHLHALVPRLQPEIFELQQSLERALAKRIHQRFSNCTAFVSAITQVTERSSTLQKLLTVAPKIFVTPEVQASITQQTRTIQPKVHTEHFTQSVRPAETLRSLAHRIAAELAARAGSLSAVPRAFELKGCLAEMVSNAADLTALQQINTLFQEIDQRLAGRLPLDDVREVLRMRERNLAANELVAQAELASEQGNWLPPAPGNAYQTLQTAIERDPDHADAKAQLEGLPAKICEFLDIQIEQAATYAANKLLSDALHVFPGQSGLLSRKARLESLLAESAARLRKDQELAELASRLGAGNAELSDEQLDELASILHSHPTSPGATALTRAIEGWINSLTNVDDQRIVARKRTEANTWDVLLRSRNWSQQMMALSARAEAYERAVAQKARAEQKRRHIGELNRACVSDNAFELSRDGVLGALGSALDKGLDEDAETAIRQQQEQLARKAEDLARTSVEATQLIDAWIAKADDFPILGELTRLVRAISERAKFVHDLKRKLGDVTHLVGSGSTMDSWVRTFFNEPQPYGDCDEISDSLGPLYEAWLAEIDKCNDSDRYGQMLQFRQWFGNSRFSARPDAQHALEMARSRLNEALIRVELHNTVRAFANSAELFLRNPNIVSLRKTENDFVSLGEDAKVSRDLLDRVVIRVDSEVRNLLERREWDAALDWIEAAENLGGADWCVEKRAMVQAHQQRETARLAQARLRLLAQDFAKQPVESFSLAARLWLGVADQERDSLGAASLLQALRSWLSQASIDELALVKGQAGSTWSALAADKHIHDVTMAADRRLHVYYENQRIANRLSSACESENILSNDDSGLLFSLKLARENGIFAVAERTVLASQERIKSELIAQLRRNNGDATLLADWLAEFRQYFSDVADQFATLIEREAILMRLMREARAIAGFFEHGRPAADSFLVFLGEVLGADWAFTEPRVLAITGEIVDTAATSLSRSDAFSTARLECAGNVASLLKVRLAGREALELLEKADRLTENVAAARSRDNAQRHIAHVRARSIELAHLSAGLAQKPAGFFAQAVSIVLGTEDDESLLARRAELIHQIAEALQTFTIPELKEARDQLQRALSGRLESAPPDVKRLWGILSELLDRKEAEVRIEASRERVLDAMSPEHILDLGPDGLARCYREASEVDERAARHLVTMTVARFEASLRAAARQKALSADELQHWLSLFGEDGARYRLPVDAESAIGAVGAEVRVRSFLAILDSRVSAGEGSLPDVSRAAHDISMLGSRCQFLEDDFRRVYRSLGEALRRVSDLEWLDELDELADFLDFGFGQLSSTPPFTRGELKATVEQRRAAIDAHLRQKRSIAMVQSFSAAPTLSRLRQLTSDRSSLELADSDLVGVRASILRKLDSLRTQDDESVFEQWLDAASSLFQPDSLAERFRRADEVAAPASSPPTVEPPPSPPSPADTVISEVRKPPTRVETPPPKLHRRPVKPSNLSGWAWSAVAMLALAVPSALYFWPADRPHVVALPVDVPKAREPARSADQGGDSQIESLRTSIKLGVFFGSNGGGAWEVVSRSTASEREQFLREFSAALTAKVRELAKVDPASARELAATARSHMQNNLQALDLLAQIDGIVSFESRAFALLNRLDDKNLTPVAMIAVAAEIKEFAARADSPGSTADTVARAWQRLLLEVNRQRAAGEIALAAEVIQRGKVVLGTTPSIEALSRELSGVARLPLVIDAKPWAEVVRVELPGGWAIGLPEAASGGAATTPFTTMVPPGTYNITLRHPAGGVTVKSMKVSQDVGAARVFVSFDVVDVDSLLQIPQG